jgi:hypothetical protein
MPWYPKAIVSMVAVLVLLLLFVRPARAWAFRVDIRYLIALHWIRFVGFYFLFLYSLRELPRNFAVLGGCGDVAVAALAVGLIFFAGHRPAVILWNVVGLADILAVAITAARDEMAAPGSMHQLDHFPLILLPTVVVPIIIVTHGLMLVRTIQKNRAVI